MDIRKHRINGSRLRSSYYMVSGAGYDASYINQICPTAITASSSNYFLQAAI